MHPDPANYLKDPDSAVDPLVRIRGSVPHLRIRILLFSSVAEKMSTKKIFSSMFLLMTFLRYIYINFHRQKVKKEVIKNQGFSYFSPVYRRIRIPYKKLTDPKNIRIIRIRIHNTGFGSRLRHHNESIFKLFFLLFFQISIFSCSERKGIFI